MSQPILVVMAAGLGSRFGGLKQIEPVGPHGEIIINYSIYDAYKAGFRHVIFIIKEENLSLFKEKIGKEAEKLMNVSYVFQKNDALPNGFSVPNDRTKPLGTGHAIYCLNGIVSSPFAVINADDFYGSDCFVKIYNYLKSAEDDDKYRYCMVGFPVENTLTENGTVSRGVCSKDKDGYLKTIIERTSIKPDGEKIVYDADGDTPGGTIPKGTPVSMNMWGFTPSFLSELSSLLKDFLKNDLIKNPLKAEFYLPFAVDNLIKSEKATVKVLDTTAKWYGITYKEDKAVIQKALKEMTDKNIY